MKFSEYILESRVDDFKTKYSQKFNKETLDRITQSVSPKFLDWVGKMMDIAVLNDNFAEYLAKVVTALKTFEKVSSNLPQTDINQYKSVDELLKALSDYQTKARRQYKQIEGGNVVYDDGRFMVVNPLTHQTSCYYGKGTKWCTAADTDHQFNNYNTDGKLFYILDRALPTSDKNYKVALLQKFDGDASFWNALDEKQIEKWFAQHNPKSTEIQSAINDYLENEFKEQLEIYRDKERAKLERMKQERLRVQRIISQRQEEANDRRADGEWDLTNPNIGSEGLKANALIKYMSENGYDVFSVEDKQRVEFLKSEIERLNTEYDNSEDTRTDLLDEIEELEDELSEYDEYIDVYSLVPDGDFYNMTSFQLVTDLDTRFAVGDEDEMENTAKEYVEQLIDDIGYDGFNQSFVQQHIDEDEVADYARSFYEEDVYSNPEVYLNDSERQLSDAQVDLIRFNKEKISKLESYISKLEENLEETEDEEIEEQMNEKIDELRDEIEELSDEITETESEPDGDFPDDLMEEKVDELVDDVKDNPSWFMSEFGLDYHDYIDKEQFIQAVIDSDGYGTVNSYDGTVDEVYVGNELFYVMRTD